MRRVQVGSYVGGVGVVGSWREGRGGEVDVIEGSGRELKTERKEKKRKIQEKKEVER